MDSASPLEVEVMFARPDVQQGIAVELPIGSTLRAAIERSRISEQYPEIDLAVNKVGVFGQLRSLDDIVQAGDRIEIYRPLLIDPKDARRKNAQAAKASGQAS
jgi:putative ubiquitin-RnfH superfamily antitoxin RatB of RatAB toxin-antitoxin module